MTNTVSTASLFAIPRNSVVDLQNQIAKAETESTTGFLADPVQTLGSQFGLYQSLNAQSNTLGNLQSSNGIVQTALTASQNVLTSVSSDAQTFTSALITAQSSGDVSSLQTQAQAFLSSLTSQLNTTEGDLYIFGGTNNSAPPVADYSGAPQAATAAAFQAAFGFPQSSPQVNSVSAASMQTFLSGSFANLFSAASWSANWSQASNTPTSALISPTEIVTTSATANNSAFIQLASAYTSIADLGIGNLNSSAQQAVISNALSLVSSATQGITGIQSTLGISQSQVTNANNQLQTQSSLIDNWVSQLGGVSPYEAATRLTNLTNQLETAYSLTDRISKLGLVNYLPA